MTAGYLVDLRGGSERRWVVPLAPLEQMMAVLSVDEKAVTMAGQLDHLPVDETAARRADCWDKAMALLLSSAY
jgi:hypothetical protein